MFISLEGIDFCGKTTQVELLDKYFKSKGKEVLIIREPGGTLISEKIRDVLLDKSNHSMFYETELFLFSASRAQLVREKIKPSLSNGIYVISDRFHDSSTAYQGYGRGIDIDLIKCIHKLAIDDVVPDLTFYLDIPIEVFEERKKLKQGSDHDRIEVSESSFYSDVRKGYLELCRSERRIRLIDGTLSIDKIHELIVKEVMNFEKTPEV